MTSATQIATTATTSIAPTQTIARITASIQNAAIRSVAEFLIELGLPILPVAPAQDPYQSKQHKEIKGDCRKTWRHCPLTKELKPEPLFTGKNPSFLNRNGKPHTINHRDYQKRLPSAKEIKHWFANPSNGIGTLGGRGYIWLDPDSKQFDSQQACDRFFEELLEKHPQLRETWLEQTQGGGYHIGVKVRETPNFTNFALEPGGAHRGEAIGEGRFVVLAPTIGIAGNPDYRCIHRAAPIEVDSLESIGIFPHSAKTPAAEPIPQRPIAPVTGGAIALEQLGNQAAIDILAGNDIENDRSASLTRAYKEWCGWENWTKNNGIAISDSAIDLAHQAGEALGLDADKVDRIIKGIDPTQCSPAAQYRGGDESCWKRVRKLDRASFEAAAPESIRASLEASYAKSDAGGKPPLKRGGSSGGGDDGDDGKGDADRNNPDRPFKAICEMFGLAFEHCVTRQQFDGSAYRNLFGGDAGDWMVMNSAFYRWNGKYWQCKDDAQIDKLITDYGEQAYKVHIQRDGSPYISRPYENNKHKESAFKYCRSRLKRDTSAVTNVHLLGFNDCVVDLRTGETMPHSQDLYLLNVIPCDYKPNAQCPDIFRNFVNEAFGAEMLVVIRAFTAMFLDPTAPFFRFPHLIGQSGGGKGTLGRFWSNLFGAEGSGSSNNFADLSTPEGRHQYLTGKRIFGFPDMGGFCQGLRAFYELVDNGAMSGRALFSPTAYSKCWNMRFWLGSVGYLQIENAGDGWARRAYPIPVIDRIIKADPHLGEKLEAVKAEVISWALAMPRAERDAILLSPPTSERSQNAAREAALFGDSTRSFVELCLRPTSEPGVTVTNEQLHSWYEAYCRIHGYAPMGMSKFVSHLKTVLRFNHVDRAWQRDEAGERYRLSAHWKAIGAIPGVFISTTEVNAGIRQNPQWTCLKSQCVEGGLEAFEEFWNPTPPAPLPEPHPPQESPKPLHSEPVQGVQAKNSTDSGVDSLKPLPRAAVQGVQAVQGKSLGVKNQGRCESIELEQAPSIEATPEPVSAIDLNEDGLTEVGQPGHPGQALCEPVSAVSTSLDSIAPSLDTLDSQSEVQQSEVPSDQLSPDRVAKAVSLLAAVASADDPMAAFQVFYQCYKLKSMAQQDQISNAIVEANLADIFYGWMEKVDIIEVGETDDLTEVAIQAAFKVLQGYLNAADYRRLMKQFPPSVLQQATERLDTRLRETVDRLRNFIMNNG